VLEVLGTWARKGHWDNAALTTGVDGTIVLSTWSDTNYGIAVLDVSGEGERPMRVVSMGVGQGTIVVPAYRNMDGTTLVLERNGTQQPLRFTRFNTEKPGPDDIDVGNGEPDVLSEYF
jgi:hypothetical protein